MITKEHIIQWLERTAQAMQENKDYLTELDAAIGDADHGANMERGFKKVVSQLPATADKEIDNILKMAGMALISSVGGAGGPLYGTLFMRAGMAISAKDELSGKELGTALQAAVDGVVQRGKARVGDKTMLDVLSPAADAFQQAIDNGADTLDALQQAVAAAEQGMRNTIPMLARKGRASYLGERSVGHQDPGATSSYLILNALLETVTSGA